MKARKLIEGATFDPATLATIGEAFDRPWAEIADHFADNHEQVELDSLAPEAGSCW